MIEVAHVQVEDRYDTYERVAEAYMLAFGVDGLDRIPFEEDELLFHVAAMRRLNVRLSGPAHAGMARIVDTEKYFTELRRQLGYLHGGAWLTPINRRKGEQDARRFYVDLASAQRAHEGKFLDAINQQSSRQRSP